MVGGSLNCWVVLLIVLICLVLLAGSGLCLCCLFCLAVIGSSFDCCLAFVICLFGDFVATRVGLLVGLIAALVFLVLVLLDSGLCRCLWGFAVVLLFGLVGFTCNCLAAKLFVCGFCGLAWLCHFGFCLGVSRECSGFYGWLVDLVLLVVVCGYCGCCVFAILLCGGLLRGLSVVCWWLASIVVMFVTRLWVWVWLQWLVWFIGLFVCFVVCFIVFGWCWLFGFVIMII